jgi:hypothetical protein
MENLLTAKEVVDRWKGMVAEGTLANWRVIGQGPAFVKIGRQVRYPLDAVVEYEKARVHR